MIITYHGKIEEAGDKGKSREEESNRLRETYAL